MMKSGNRGLISSFPRDGRFRYLLEHSWPYACVLFLLLTGFPAEATWLRPDGQPLRVIVYDMHSYETYIYDAMAELGFEESDYTVRGYQHLPLTAADLRNCDVLIMGQNTSEAPQWPDPTMLADGITGRVIVTGHDADQHSLDSQHMPAKMAATQFFAQCISFVTATPGCGLVVLGDSQNDAFSFLHAIWGIDAVGGNDESHDESHDRVMAITSAGQASGVYDGLTAGDMSNWLWSRHCWFRGWGSQFVPFEYGKSSDNVITIARTIGYGVNLTMTSSVGPTNCVSQDASITYYGTCSYPAYAGTATTYPATICDVTITDTLPGGVTFSSASTPYTWNPAARTVTWLFENVAKGGSRTFSLVVQVNTLASQYSHLHNTAKLTCRAGWTTASQDTRVCGSSGGQVYVNWEAAPGGDGTTWLKAFRRLQDGLAAAANTTAKTVWVAQGIYAPGTSYDDSFLIPGGEPMGVKVYGGFTGVEGPGFNTDLRNLDLTKTVLDGTIQRQDRNHYIVTMGNNSLLDGCLVQDSAWRGISGEGVSFTVQKCDVQNNSQDGIRLEDAIATVNWCKIHGNTWNGVYANNNDNSSKTLAVANCHINRNLQDGILAISCTPTIKNSVITQNGGGCDPITGWPNPLYGMSLNGTRNGVVRNCTVTSNTAFGIYRSGGDVPDIRNCILWANNGSGWQTTSGLNVSYSCVMNDANAANSIIHSDPCFGYTEPNIAYHLLPDSLCINAGDNVSAINYSLEKDIDGDARLYNGRVDIGADEATCSDVYNVCDWSQDGRVTMVDFATFARSWRSRDPNGPPFNHDLWPNPWNAKVNLYMDSAIDEKDLRAFAQWYLWAACWYHQPPPGLTMDACNDPNIYYVPGEPYYDPNEPYDPNGYGDPNDPNGFGMMTMGGDMNMAMSANGEALSDSGLTAGELEECISLLSDISWDTQEDADNIAEFILGLQQELDALYGRQGFDLYIQ